MAIVHHVRGDDRSEIKNYPEIENEDGVLTYNVTGLDHLPFVPQLVKLYPHPATAAQVNAYEW